MKDDLFDRLMRDAAQSYNRPPDPPLDEMWSTIQRRRAPRRMVAIPRWLPIAAALVGGVVLGRYAMPRPSVPAAASAVAASPLSTTTPTTPAAFPHDEPGTGKYFIRTAAFVVSLPEAMRRSRGDSAFIDQANDLLLATRLMLDSPAAADPAHKRLFEDLELVFAQVVRLRRDSGPSELDLIDQSVQQTDLIPRLRTAVADHSAN